jgi:hypothetical protein
MTSQQVSWLAGLFEGEGCVLLFPKGREALNLQMTDEDVVRRAHAVSRVGHVYGPVQPKGPNRKPVWRWHVRKSSDVAGLAMTMYPLLGARRRAAVRKMLAAWTVRPIYPKTHCLKGHPYTPENTRRVRDGKVRLCNECTRTYHREWARANRQKRVVA